MCHDRSTGDELPLTQEFLSIMLGAHRPSVTTSALVLQSSGFIKYRRGLITFLDREGLEDFTFDCYQIVKQDDEHQAGLILRLNFNPGIPSQS
jgi:hypothetical protein